MNNNYIDPFEKTRPIYKMKPELKLKRSNRETTNLNDHELHLAEQNRERLGYDDMASFIRAKILDESPRPIINIPELNIKTADALIEMYNNFNTALAAINACATASEHQQPVDLIQSFYAFGEVAAQARQELYGNMDHETLFNFMVNVLTPDEFNALVLKTQERKHD
ncbi:hypothetical protein [uncultured Tolumonas sp.]|uniref:hypothetical protein n=1 Tax=uncultured Tolumonas sp. TaxID=263765 RepID=UPI00292ED264|nr:hypothetical protein [uncultured Tolumonas sp.]